MAAVTRAEFGNSVLGRLEIGRLGSFRATMAWMHAESAELPNSGVSGKGPKWNPLCTTQPWAGSTNYNSVGVRNYATFKDGVDATIETLTNGLYDELLDTMRVEGISAGAVCKAIAATPWSGTPPNPEYEELLLERLDLYLSDKVKYAGLPVGV
jgi:hypothetical protein